MGEVESTCITWKSGSERFLLGDLRKYAVIEIKCVVLKKCGKNIGG